MPTLLWRRPESLWRKWYTEAHGWCRGRRLSARLGGLLLALLAAPAVEAGTGKWPVDRRGARMMSYSALIDARPEFDHKFVWIIGGLVFKSGVARLGGEPGGKGERKESVCVRPIEAFTDPAGTSRIAILRRFDGLEVVSVHGRYELAPTDECPNGTLFAAQIEVSLE